MEEEKESTVKFHYFDPKDLARLQKIGDQINKEREAERLRELKAAPLHKKIKRLLGKCLRKAYEVLTS